MAIYISNRLSHHSVTNPPLSHLECTNVLVNFPSNVNILFSSIYIKQDLPLPSEDLANILNLNSNVLLTGDFDF